MPREFGERRNPSWDALRARTLIGGEISETSFNAGGGVENKIYVWHADGSTLDTFDPTEAGLSAAIGAAATDDTIWLPSIDIACTAGVTIPASVTIIGISDRSLLSFSGFSGTAITLGASATIAYCSMSYTSNGSTEIAIDATAIGCRVEHVHVTVTGLAATSIGIKSGTTIGLGAAREVWALYSMTGPVYFVAWSSDYFDTSSPTWHTVTVPTGYEINPHGEWSSSDNNFQVCQDQNSNVYLCGQIGSPPKYTIWQLTNVNTIRLAPATAPTWTIIMQQNVTTVISGTAKVSGTFNSWALLAYQNKLYARLADNNLSSAIIWSIHDGSAWTFNNVAVGNSYPAISRNGMIIEPNPGDPYVVDDSTGALVGTFTVTPGGTLSHFMWQNATGYYVQRVPPAGTNTLLHRVGSSDYDTGVAGFIDSRMTGAWTGTDKYFVLANGHLLRAPTDLDFSDIATWNWGIAFNTILDGSGNILWVRDTVPNGSEPFRLIQTNGTLIADRKGDFWTVVAPITGANDIELLNVGLVYNITVAGDMPHVIDSEVESTGTSSIGLSAIGFVEVRQTRFNAHLDLSISADGHVYADDITYATLSNSGVLEPLRGDRAAFDATGYATRHTNDTDAATTAIHHTLGSGADQAAAGNHTHTIPTAANPTAQVGPTAINGGAATYMRSDAAPKLADTTVTPATYGDSTHAPQIAVDQQGRITTASNVAIAIPTVGKYRQFLYTYTATDLTFLTDSDGKPLFVLSDLE